MNAKLRVLLIGDSDSQLHYCHALTQTRERESLDFTLNIVPREGTPDHLLSQFETISRIWHYRLDRLLRQPSLADFDAIGVFLTGSQIAGFRTTYHQACQQHGRQPAILFCGFNGVVLENFEEGISWRLGYDFICLNGPRDLERLHRFLRFTPFTGQKAVITGLRRRSPDKMEPGCSDDARTKRLIFAEQVLMPRRPADRCQMMCILADLARRSPSWDIIIKPRIQPGERTFHQALEHITETIDKAVGAPPANMSVSYEPIADLLKGSRLMCTVSSTAVFDAMDLGCRPVVMADFESQSGNGTSFFKDSGILVRLHECPNLDALDAQLMPPNPDWLEWIGYAEKFSPASLYDQIRRQPLSTNQYSDSLFKLPGYEIAHISSNVASVFGYTSNQLRSEAEEAIQQGQWDKAEELLSDALQQKPDNRNIKRRLGAVRSKNQLLRYVRLKLSPRFELKS